MTGKTAECKACGKEKPCKRCYGCSRMVCHLCSIEWDDDVFDGIESNAPQVIRTVCRHCDTLSRPYMAKALVAYDSLRNSIEDIKVEWVCHCKRSLLNQRSPSTKKIKI